MENSSENQFKKVPNKGMESCTEAYIEEAETTTEESRQ